MQWCLAVMGSLTELDLRIRCGAASVKVHIVICTVLSAQVLVAKSTAPLTSQTVLLPKQSFLPSSSAAALKGWYWIQGSGGSTFGAEGSPLSS